MAKLVLLLVDDDVALTKALLRGIGDVVDVVVANGPESAREVLSQRHIDVIATDFIMEAGTGLSLLDWARDHHPAVRRVLFSGLVDSSHTAALLAAGRVHAVLAKPFEVPQLLAVVAAVAVGPDRPR